MVFMALANNFLFCASGSKTSVKPQGRKVKDLNAFVGLKDMAKEQLASKNGKR
jgi:hypothetical protein